MQRGLRLICGYVGLDRFDPSAPFSLLTSCAGVQLLKRLLSYARTLVRCQWEGPMTNFLTTLAGARPEILDQCRTERVKFEMLGWVILITSGMATVSMWFALTSAMGINPFLAVVPALLWGLVIMGIDRWLVTSISTPFVLRIFQSEIDAQITVIKQQRASAFIAQQQNSKVGQQATYWTKQVANLQKVIDSHGAVPLDPSTDPQVRSLTRQRAAALKLEDKYYHQWRCQLYGGPGCPKGNGPLAQASQRVYDKEVAQVAVLTRAIHSRESSLSAANSASKQLRLQQAQAALPGALRQKSIAVARESALRAGFDAHNLTTNGLLIRLQALGQLTGQNSTLDAARILLFLLFLLIECLPVTVKLMWRPGNYEKILEAAADRELKDARRFYKTRSAVADAPAPGAGPNGTRSFGADGPQDFDPFDTRETLNGIWQRSMQDTARTTTTGPWPEQPEETDERARLNDEALREMADTRGNARLDLDSGGFDLNYEPDDL